jgi:MFS family permease
MKFSEFFTAPTMRAAALRIGITVGAIMAIFTQMDWRYAILIGAVVALLASVILPLAMYIKLLPFKKFKESLGRPILLDAPVRFLAKRGMIGGFFLLSEENLVLLSEEKEKPALELTQKDVASIALGEDVGVVDIYLDQKQFIRFVSAIDEEIVETLEKHGWNVTRRKDFYDHI